MLLEFISSRESLYKLTYEWHKLIYMRLLKFQNTTCHLFTCWVSGWEVTDHTVSVSYLSSIYLCLCTSWTPCVKLHFVEILDRCLIIASLCMWEQMSHMSPRFGGLFGVKLKGHGWHFNVISGWKRCWRRRRRQEGQKGVDWGVMAVQRTGLGWGESVRRWGSVLVHMTTICERSYPQ